MDGKTLGERFRQGGAPEFELWLEGTIERSRSGAGPRFKGWNQGNPEGNPAFHAVSAKEACRSLGGYPASLELRIREVMARGAVLVDGHSRTGYLALFACWPEGYQATNMEPLAAMDPDYQHSECWSGFFEFEKNLLPVPKLPPGIVPWVLFFWEVSRGNEWC